MSCANQRHHANIGIRQPFTEQIPRSILQIRGLAPDLGKVMGDALRVVSPIIQNLRGKLLPLPLLDGKRLHQATSCIGHAGCGLHRVAEGETDN